MIYLYSGTPGSGKSYHAVADIYYRLRKRKGFKRVIANFPLNINSPDFQYMDNEEMTIDNLIAYARQNHKLGLEGQTLIVVDEAQIIFNSRNWNSDGNSRMDWIKFFTQHRKLGFNFILIAQFDRMLDRQIRCLIEYEIAHMKVNNFFRIIPMTVFLCVTRWYGQRMKIGHELIAYRKRIANLYDTFRMFSQEQAEQGMEGDQGAPGRELPAISEVPAEEPPKEAEAV
jgi:zona occludens toxin (predicted ATPase)